MQLRYNERQFVMIFPKKEKDEEKWPRLWAKMGKNRLFTIDWDRWEDSDAEEEPDPNKKHWTADMHRAFTGGHNGGMDIEHLAKQDLFKDRFRTATIGGLGGGNVETTGMTTVKHEPPSKEEEEGKAEEPAEEAEENK